MQVNKHNNYIRSALAFYALLISFFVPIIAYAYTGVTIVLGAATEANQEFVDQFKIELVNAKRTNLRVNVITLSETERLIDSDDFFDIHQSFRANLNYWDGEKVATADRLLGLTNGRKLPVADRKLSKLRAELKKRKDASGRI